MKQLDHPTHETLVDMFVKEGLCARHLGDFRGALKCVKSALEIAELVKILKIIFTFIQLNHLEP